MPEIDLGKMEEIRHYSIPQHHDEAAKDEYPDDNERNNACCFFCLKTYVHILQF